MTSQQLILIALGTFTLAAAYRDLRTGHIPNRLVVVGFVAGATLQLAVQVVWAETATASWTASLTRFAMAVVIGLLVCGLVPYLLFRFGAMGGGDVKLLATVGAASGPFLGMQIELFAFVLMALFALAQMAYRGRLLVLIGNSVRLLLNPVLPKGHRKAVPNDLLTPLPFAPAVFVATLLVAAGEVWSL